MAIEKQGLNSIEQTKTNNDKEKNLQNKIKIVVIQKFSDFSIDQKNTLISHFNKFLKIFPESNLATVYKIFQETLRKNWSNPEKMLKKIQILIERKTLDVENKKNKDKILNPSKDTNLSWTKNLAQKFTEKYGNLNNINNAKNKIIEKIK